MGFIQHAVDLLFEYKWNASSAEVVSPRNTPVYLVQGVRKRYQTNHPKSFTSRGSLTKTFQRGRLIGLTNPLFAGGNVYAGGGSPDLIRYRQNRTYCGQAPPLNPQLANDVSIATAASPTNSIPFAARLRARSVR